MRRAAKVDSTQKAIVAALRQAGAFVYVIGRPVDLLCFYRQWYLLEVKSEADVSHHKKPRKDQQEQQAFCKLFGVPIVRTVDEALAAIGCKVPPSFVRERNPYPIHSDDWWRFEGEQSYAQLQEILSD